MPTQTDIGQLIQTIVRYFEYPHSAPSTIDGEKLGFEGSPNLGPDFGCLRELEADIGMSLPSDIAEFLATFGGCRLFKNGVDINIYAPTELRSINGRLQSTTRPFYPEIVVIGDDYAGDLLVLVTSDERIHFGNLHHEAWAEPEVWRSEAITACRFTDWLEMILKDPEGSTIPEDEIQYGLF